MWQTMIQWDIFQNWYKILLQEFSILTDCSLWLQVNISHIADVVGTIADGSKLFPYKVLFSGKSGKQASTLVSNKSSSWKMMKGPLMALCDRFSIR